MEAGASWGVAYRDGTTFTRFNADGSENVWGDIRWDDVIEVAFASADAEATYAFEHPGSEWDVRLGSRVAMALETCGFIDAVRSLILVTYTRGAVISETSVARVFHWFPDGTAHDCDQYNCPEAAAYLSALAHGTERPAIAQSHSGLTAAVSAELREA